MEKFTANMETRIDWEKVDGLVPSIVQDASTLQVLMLGYMNRLALSRTQETGEVHFFSRTRARLWRKGEESGHTLRVRSLRLDCDRDTVLILAEPRGPTCHLGQASCFCALEAEGVGFLSWLSRRIAKRRLRAAPHESYTARLLSAGTGKITEKITEESAEVATQAIAHALSVLGPEDKVQVGFGARILDAHRRREPDRVARGDFLCEEIADLLYHLLVLLEDRGISLQTVLEVLRARSKRGEEC